jgi:hypothetical protein
MKISLLRDIKSKQPKNQEENVNIWVSSFCLTLGFTLRRSPFFGFLSFRSCESDERRTLKVLVVGGGLE